MTLASEDRAGVRLEPGLLPASRLLTHPAEVLAARRLHAQEYLRSGYVRPDEVTVDGVLAPEADPYVAHSRYFGAFDDSGDVSAACRVISAETPQPLPTLQLPTMSPGVRRQLEDLPPGTLGEIASLARRRGAGTEHVRAAFRAVWLDGLERGLTAWVLCVDALVLRTLRGMDPEIFRVVGPASPAPVRPVFPVWTLVADVRDEIFTRGLAPREIVLP